MTGASHTELGGIYFCIDMPRLSCLCFLRALSALQVRRQTGRLADTFVSKCGWQPEHKREKPLRATITMFNLSRDVQEKFTPLVTRLLFVIPVLSDLVTFVVKLV